MPVVREKLRGNADCATFSCAKIVREYGLKTNFSVFGITRKSYFVRSATKYLKTLKRNWSGIEWL